MIKKISQFIRNLRFFQRLFISIGICILLFASVTAFQWSGINKTGWEKQLNQKHPDYDFIIHEMECENLSKGHVNAKLEIQRCLESYKPSLTRQESEKAYPYNTYVKDQLEGNIVGSGIFAVAIFVLLSIVSQYHNEMSVGWKRMSLVLSALISPLVGFYNDDGYNDKKFLAIIISYPVSILTLLYAKVIYGWIKDGFDADKGYSSPKVVQSQVVANQSFQKQEKLPATVPVQENVESSQTDQLEISKGLVEQKKLTQSLTDFMQRLYRGEVPLVYTWWVFWVALGIVVRLILLGFISLVNEPSLFILLIYKIVLFAWIFFVSLIVWRSASNYSKFRQGTNWGGIAKIGVVLGLLSNIGNILPK